MNLMTQNVVLEGSVLLENYEVIEFSYFKMDCIHKKSNLYRNKFLSMLS